MYYFHIKVVIFILILFKYLSCKLRILIENIYYEFAIAYATPQIRNSSTFGKKKKCAMISI